MHTASLYLALLLSLPISALAQGTGPGAQMQTSLSLHMDIVLPTSEQQQPEIPLELTERLLAVSALTNLYISPQEGSAHTIGVDFTFTDMEAFRAWYEGAEFQRLREALRAPASYSLSLQVMRYSTEDMMMGHE